MDPNQLLLRIATAEGFDWDRGNTEKNLKHGVEQLEIEQVFFSPPSVVFPDDRHSSGESRWMLFGKTFSGRHLVVVFTLRNSLIRPISARPMNRKEVQFYEEETKKNPPL